MAPVSETLKQYQLPYIPFPGDLVFFRNRYGTYEVEGINGEVGVFKARDGKPKVQLNLENIEGVVRRGRIEGDYLKGRL